ncbi:hypothetical protein CEY16_08065 [Halalkalibacillus sediminis]|uniref:DZANK-type domain-containing protein n=1 Tax=Halalkalibacillus sediminis TaxID=2018042 RepID=A0A2I0QU98_9BACI|nr:hypothetical protein [Halalkalibacillus sediminis]PKR77874.1 hypothetical protein CEY16_08065 [Halalkalibacillus sediminis]
MIQCPNCKKQVSDDPFCEQCGSQQKCLECGKRFVHIENFCGECGTERKLNNSASTSKNVIGTGNRKFLVGVGVLILAIFFMLNPPGSLSGEPTSPAEIVEEFYNLIQSANVAEAGKYLHSSIPWNVEDAEIPEGASITVLSLEEKIHGDYATVEAVLELYPEPYYYDGPEVVFVDLEKEGGKWLITDME